MREIVMKTISAGPGGVFHPGTRRTLPRHEAAVLVLGGYAEFATVEPEQVEIVEPVEVAEPEPVPIQKKRGRKPK